MAITYHTKGSLVGEQRWVETIGYAGGPTILTKEEHDDQRALNARIGLVMGILFCMGGVVWAVAVLRRDREFA